MATSAREQRGFALYVGLSEHAARESGIELGEMVEELKAKLAVLSHRAQSHALVVVASIGNPAADLEIVLRATVENARTGIEPVQGRQAAGRRDGVIIDLARHRVLVDGRDANFTFKEYALLDALVRNAGVTLLREQLRSEITTDLESEVNSRTIDVHVRRLRMKFGEYPDVIRTVHGKGYRFDFRSDVTIVRSSTPSPDLI
jgi:DNA-binding response OmpR family regulator